MALFRRKGAEGTPPAATETRHPLVSRTIYCAVCDAERKFSRCWRRLYPERTCAACGTVFEAGMRVYQQIQPACPKCEEPLEQPGFDYGLCDQCGSKFEIMEGTKPGLLPNRAQRDAMNQRGRARRVL